MCDTEGNNPKITDIIKFQKETYIYIYIYTGNKQ